MDSTLIPQLTDVSVDKGNAKLALISKLKHEVEETFGRRIISSRDCIQLSEDIYFKAGDLINPNTLRRLYGLVKADYPASTSTLSLLAKYCGFSSLDDINNSKVNQESETDKDYDNILNYLVSLFKSTHVKDANDETYLSLVKHTVAFIEKNQNIADKFQRQISKTKNGQEYYFELFVNIDRLNSYYGEGLRYYLNERIKVEAQVFGYSLLCMRSWLNSDNNGIKKLFEVIKKQKLSKTVHPFVSARYLAAHLYFAELNGLNTDAILREGLQIHSSTEIIDDTGRNFPFFEYLFALPLLLTKHYQEALYYTDHAIKNYSVSYQNLDKEYFKTLELIHALALIKCGNRKDAELVYNNLRPSQFYFLNRKFNTILYLMLGNFFNKRNKKTEEQLEELIQDTGFIRLKSLR